MLQQQKKRNGQVGGEPVLLAVLQDEQQDGQDQLTVFAMLPFSTFTPFT